MVQARHPVSFGKESSVYTFLVKISLVKVGNNSKVEDVEGNVEGQPLTCGVSKINQVNNEMRVGPTVAPAEM